MPTNLHMTHTHTGQVVMVYYNYIVTDNPIKPFIQIDLISMNLKPVRTNGENFSRILEECFEDYIRTKPIYEASNKRKNPTHDKQLKVR